MAVAYGLWQKRLNFDPASPTWPNRDRFILSAGHASMLLYALPHLTKTQAVNAEYETLGLPSIFPIIDGSRITKLDRKG
jgi:transketolase